MDDRKYTPKNVTISCITCGVSHTYPHQTGMHKKHCSPECRVKHQISRARIRKETVYPKCSVDGCANSATRVGAGMCEKHYGRQRRGVSLADKVHAFRYKTSHGYIVLADHVHPLASKRYGRVAEHRKVAYDMNGGICPPCYWCGALIDWDGSHIDHLDEVKDNNAPENLVVACSACNRLRGATLPFLARVKPERFAQLMQHIMAYHRTHHNSEAQARDKERKRT